MNEAEMIFDMTGMQLPPGIECDYDSGWRFYASNKSGRMPVLLCECNGFHSWHCENHIGENLKTLYEKCWKYHNMKIRENKEKKKQDFEQAIQLIKDL